MGDFNLDVRMMLRHGNNYKIPLSLLTDFTDANNLIQQVKFNTWFQTINGVRKESLLDQIYVDDIAFIKDIDYRELTFGDHLLVFIELTFCYVVQTNATLRRDWRNYSKASLLNNLELENIDENINDV